VRLKLYMGCDALGQLSSMNLGASRCDPVEMRRHQIGPPEPPPANMTRGPDDPDPSHNPPSTAAAGNGGKRTLELYLCRACSWWL